MDWSIVVMALWMVAERLVWFAAGAAVGLIVEWRWQIIEHALRRVCHWTDCEKGSR